MAQQQSTDTLNDEEIASLQATDAIHTNAWNIIVSPETVRVAFSEIVPLIGRGRTFKTAVVMSRPHALQFARMLVAELTPQEPAD
jgi:hypothetical protein